MRFEDKAVLSSSLFRCLRLTLAILAQAQAASACAQLDLFERLCRKESDFCEAIDALGPEYTHLVTHQLACTGESSSMGLACNYCMHQPKKEASGFQAKELLASVLLTYCNLLNAPAAQLLLHSFSDQEDAVAEHVLDSLHPLLPGVSVV